MMQTFHQASGSEPLHLLQAHTVLCHFLKGGKVRTVSKVRVASKTGNTVTWEKGKFFLFSIMTSLLVCNR